MHVDLCYCQDCLNTISQWGEPASVVFETICEWYATQQEAMLIYDYEISILQVVEFLESKGFIITTDIDENDIAAKPSHYFALSGFEMICADKRHHIEIKMPGEDD